MTLQVRLAFGSVFLVSALALGSGCPFLVEFYIHRSPSRVSPRPLARGSGPVGKRVPRPTDPAHDLKTSLAETYARLAAGRSGEPLASEHLRHPFAGRAKAPQIELT